MDEDGSDAGSVTLEDTEQDAAAFADAAAAAQEEAIAAAAPGGVHPDVAGFIVPDSDSEDGLEAQVAPAVPLSEAEAAEARLRLEQRIAARFSVAAEVDGEDAATGLADTSGATRFASVISRWEHRLLDRGIVFDDVAADAGEDHSGEEDASAFTDEHAYADDTAS